jgi:hypothetical protein
MECSLLYNIAYAPAVIFCDKDTPQHRTYFRFLSGSEYYNTVFSACQLQNNHKYRKKQLSDPAVG